jgi:hypothetical protein
METKTNPSVPALTRGRFIVSMMLCALGAVVLQGCTGNSEITADERLIDLSDRTLTVAHRVGGSPCPQTVGTFEVTNRHSVPMKFSIDQPSGLEVAPARFELKPGEKVTITVKFLCEREPPLNTEIEVKGLEVLDPSSTLTPEEFSNFVDVNVNRG